MSQTAIALVAGLGGALIGAGAAVLAQIIANRANAAVEKERWSREREDRLIEARRDFYTRALETVDNVAWSENKKDWNRFADQHRGITATIRMMTDDRDVIDAFDLYTSAAFAVAKKRLRNPRRMPPLPHDDPYVERRRAFAEAARREIGRPDIPLHDGPGAHLHPHHPGHR